MFHSLKNITNLAFHHLCQGLQTLTSLTSIAIDFAWYHGFLSIELQPIHRSRQIEGIAVQTVSEALRKLTSLQTLSLDFCGFELIEKYIIYFILVAAKKLTWT